MSQYVIYLTFPSDATDECEALAAIRAVIARHRIPAFGPTCLDNIDGAMVAHIANPRPSQDAPWAEAVEAARCIRRRQLIRMAA